ncbi:MAG TPA: Gfo/Idh/MocA family oxidoreductase [Chloroflexota bacterium]|nr:Gfo/Idh/MocA family oxidoreductase [Chloroflexota bacterium]
MDRPTRVGVIGCGQISGIYFETARRMRDIEVIACADVVLEAVKFRADMYDIPRRYTPEQLLADPEVEIVLNLTIPQVHAEVSLAALEAGKHVYTEKPLATSLADGRRILDLAVKKGLRVGCAPDTFLGAGIQTCKELIEDGVIGEPVAAVAFLMHHGIEMNRPTPTAPNPTRQRVTEKDPSFYYQPGVGPMFDMGPYYLTALSVLIGPVRRATGSARITWPERPVGNPQFKVNTPTHIAGVLDHENGAVSTIITSIDVWPTELPRIEIYGESGTLSVPDPNTFGGPVRLRKANEREWTDVPVTRPYQVNSRGLGVADLAHAARLGRPHRASGDLAYHVLEVMHAIHDASREGRHVQVTSNFPRPKTLEPGLADGELD